VVQIASLLSFLLSFSAALLIGNFVRTPQRLKWIVGAFLVFGTLMLLTQLFHIRQGFLNDRGLWALWLVAPVYGLIIAQPNLGWRWRAALIGLLVLTFYQTMVAQSLWVSGWAPGLAAIVAITFLRSRKAFLVLAVVGGLALYASQTFFQQVAIDNINEGSLERIAIWEQSWGLAQQHWLFGTGPAGYAIYYITYYRDDARSTHNNYLDILAQFGVVGMLLWLWFVLTSLWEGWRLVQRAPPGIVRTLAIVATGGWFGAMASMMFGDWILPFAYNQTITGYRYTVYSWIFLGMLISIRQILSAPPPEPAAQTL
jgi:O-antigen ligase